MGIHGGHADGKVNVQQRREAEVLSGRLTSASWGGETVAIFGGTLKICAKESNEQNRREQNEKGWIA